MISHESKFVYFGQWEFYTENIDLTLYGNDSQKCNLAFHL